MMTFIISTLLNVPPHLSMLSIFGTRASGRLLRGCNGREKIALRLKAETGCCSVTNFRSFGRARNYAADFCRHGGVW